MTELISRIMNFFAQFKLFVTIMPWERAVRVRLGSRIQLWDPGWHIRLPFIDEVILMNTRLRIADTGSQTLTTLDGATLTVGLNIGFSISDPITTLLRMQNPEQACAAIAGSWAAALVSTSTRLTLTVPALETYVLDQLKHNTPYDFEFVRVRDFAYATTFRLLNEQNYRSASVHIEERKI